MKPLIPLLTGLGLTMTSAFAEPARPASTAQPATDVTCRYGQLNECINSAAQQARQSGKAVVIAYPERDGRESRFRVLPNGMARSIIVD